jgi:hypothetical protein
MQLLLSIALSLLPAMYRRRVLNVVRVNTARGALLSGVAEFVVCLVLFAFRYIYFLQYRVGRFAEDLVRHNAEDAMDSLSVQWGAGMVSLGEYLVNPVTLLLVYFMLEGSVRFSAAVVHGEQEVMPTLPLQLIAWAHAGILRLKHERDLGPLIVDEVQQDGINPIVRIASCRPKPWNDLTTIAYEKKLYEIAKAEPGSAPRPYVYVLRPRPEHKVIRGLYEYEPDELVTPPKTGEEPEPERS